MLVLMYFEVVNALNNFKKGWSEYRVSLTQGLLPESTSVSTFKTLPAVNILDNFDVISISLLNKSKNVLSKKI